MYRITEGAQYTRLVTNRILAGFLALPVAAILSVCTLKLFTGPTVPTQSSAIGDFTLPIFTGYANVVMAFSGPVNTGGQTQGLVGGGLFVATPGGPFVPDLVTGYLIQDFNAVLVMAERFSLPVPFNAAGDFLELDLIVPEPSFVASTF